MYYKNNKNYIYKSSAKVPLSRFKGVNERAEEDSLPIDYVSYLRGCETRDGKLVSSFGVHELTSEDGSSYGDIQFDIDSIYAYYMGDKRHLIANCQGRAYVLDEVKKEWLIQPNIYFSGENSVVFSIDQQPALIIPRLDGGLYSYMGYGFAPLDVSYNITTMATHMNRLFLVDKTDQSKLIFSSVGDPQDFTISLDKGGEISLDPADGKIIKLISHNGNLYIFMEYSIYRLTAFSDQRDFVLKKVTTTPCKIDKNSIVLAEGVFVMRDSEGLKVFDGYNIKPVLSEYKETLSSCKGVYCATYYDGVYYLSFSQDGHSHASLLRYNMVENTFSAFDNVGVRCLFVARTDNAGNEILTACDNMRRVGIIDSSGELFGRSIKKEWKSANIDFGEPLRDKEITGFFVNSNDRYTLIIKGDDGTRRRYVVDGTKVYYVVGLSAKSFGFTITSRSNRDVHTPIINVKV